MNRLKDEKSLYLLQHAENPVQWYPWSAEAFERAERENRLIFLSIGYSSCHWCHVMERECFEDPEVAGLLNRDFISIKVDREERPDVDDVFMTLCQAMTSRGGWPLSIFLTPRGRPFFAATYIPKTGQGRYPGMLELLPRIAELWKRQPEMILNEADRIYSALHYQEQKVQRQTLEPALPERLFGVLKESFDPEWGGFGRAPKFPMPGYLLFLIDYARHYPESEALEMLKKTLYSMSLGGIRDHLSGGFHRYSTDRYWRLPHFEKMLYDQALLLEVFSEAYSLTGEELFREVAQEIVSFIKGWFMSEEGLFYTALDADTEGEEGGYYLWSMRELNSVLEGNEAERFFSLFNIKEEGNFRDEATGRLTGKNILYREHLPEQAEKEWLKGVLKKLLEVRMRRSPPALDRKVLCDLNGLTISALVRFARHTGSQEAVGIAENTARFFIHCSAEPSGLSHCYYEKEAYVRGMLTDYAFFVRALLDLYSLTEETDYLKEAERLTHEALKEFYSRERATFRPYKKDPHLIDIMTEPFDGVLPSALSIMLEDLYRLYRFTMKEDYRSILEDCLSSLAFSLNRTPQNYSYLMRLLLSYKVEKER
ncbi:MAG: thioredoxin domain-containing protein [Nitrospirae bacterium]|nr:MAG: thioredoxin domain-containing protein [Nitrospirota bacterium]